jgi:CheY-like chemotaxis protein
LYFPVAEQQAAAVSPPPRKIAAGNGERVLYIDDDDAIVHLSSRILERLGYRVAGFTHPEEALAVFNERPNEFDVAVTDLSMPGMSGFDLARVLRKARPDLPVLMTSGYVRPEDRAAARDLGIHDFILKPNTVEELGHSLDKVFRELRDARAKE